MAVTNGTPPRVWGKPYLLSTASPHSNGTPPRVWGKLWLFLFYVSYSIWYTPTCVGKTVGHLCRTMRLRYTPTRGGKRCLHRHHFQDSIGTPPRVWGKTMSSQFDVHICPRYTPTRWGKRSPPLPGIRRRRYTPTCVGKNLVIPGPAAAMAGTPPRGRGENAALRVAPMP